MSIVLLMLEQSVQMAQWLRGHASEPRVMSLSPTGAIWCWHMVADMSK